MTRPIRLEHLQGCIDWWGGAERKGRKETERAWKVTGDEVKARLAYPVVSASPYMLRSTWGRTSCAPRIRR